MAIGDSILQCRTVRRRADEVAFDGKLLDHITVHYEDFILNGGQVDRTGEDAGSRCACRQARERSGDSAQNNVHNAEGLC